MQYTVKSLAEELGLVHVIERAFSFHDEYFPGQLWRVPVTLNDRLQRVAGKCRYTQLGVEALALELHPALFGPFAKRNELVETFLHELAHAMAWERYGAIGRGHGEHWSEMMHQLGQRPVRCHCIAACTKATEKAKVGLDDMGL